LPERSHGLQTVIKKVSPALAPIVLLLAGYLTLLSFWRYGHNPSGLPGLFHYHSATWGDGLLLPLLALFLALLTRDLPKPSKQWPTWVARAVGAASGALVVFTWWADPKPSANWTIPRAHVLTHAGWWHAGFLVAASAFFAGSWIELFRRLRGASNDPVDHVMRQPLLAAAFGCTTGYAWLAAADSARAGQTASGRGSLVALILASAVLIGCMVWAAHGVVRSVAQTAVGGLVIATTAVAITSAYGRAAPFMLICAVAGSLGAGLALAAAPGHRVRFAAMEILTVPALFAALTLIAMRTTELVLAVVAPAIAIFCSVLLRYLYSETDKRYKTWLSVDYLAGAGISASLLAAGIFGLWLGAHHTKAYVTGGFLLTILGAILGGVFLPYFKTDYERLMQVEGDATQRRSGERPGDSQFKAARGAWVRLAGYAVSAFASMLVLTVALGPSLGWNNGRAPIPWVIPLFGMLAVTILVAPALGGIAAAHRRHPAKGSPLVPTGHTRHAWWSIAGGGAAIVAGILSLRSAGLNLFALLQSTLLAAFALQNILGNGGWLHARRLHPVARLAAAVNGLSVFTLIYWSLTTGIRPHGVASSLGTSFFAWIAATAVVVLLVEVGACAVYVAGGQPYATDYPPADNSAQDIFLIACMWFVLGWVPQTVMSHVPAAAHERLAVIGTVLAGFLLIFGPAFLWILENNDTHVERQRRIRKVAKTGALLELSEAHSSYARIRILPKRIAELAQSIRDSRNASDSQLSQNDFVVRLSGHTAIQNSIAIALATATIIGIIGVSSGLTQNATGLAGLPDEGILNSNRPAGTD
jgi:hypothetical protein